ncbi:hypothetical protein BGZ94_000388 [Podila epigama]|nr:hypothetical protein BGZ94_000388 [Podila epigama]
MASLPSPASPQNPMHTFLDKKPPLMPRQSTSDVLSFTRIISNRLKPGQNVWDFFSPAPEASPSPSTDLHPSSSPSFSQFPASATTASCPNPTKNTTNSTATATTVGPSDLPPMSPSAPLHSSGTNGHPANATLTPSAAFLSPTSPISPTFAQFQTFFKGSGATRRQSLATTSPDLGKSKSTSNNNNSALRRKSSDHLVAMSTATAASATTTTTTTATTMATPTAAVDIVAGATGATAGSHSPHLSQTQPNGDDNYITPKLQKRRSFAQSIKNGVLSLTQLLSPTSSSANSSRPTSPAGPPHYNILVLGSDSAPLASTLYKMSSLLPATTKISHYQEISGFFVAYFRSNGSFSCSPKTKPTITNGGGSGKSVSRPDSPTSCSSPVLVQQSNMDEVKTRHNYAPSPSLRSVRTTTSTHSPSLAHGSGSGRPSEETLQSLQISSAENSNSFHRRASVSTNTSTSTSSSSTTANSLAEMEIVDSDDNESHANANAMVHGSSGEMNAQRRGSIALSTRSCSSFASSTTSSSYLHKDGSESTTDTMVEQEAFLTQETSSSSIDIQEQQSQQRQSHQDNELQQSHGRQTEHKHEQEEEEEEEKDIVKSPSANASLSVHAFSLDTTWPVPRILAQTFWFPFAHGMIYIVDATRKNDPRGIDHLLNARHFLNSLITDPHFKRRDIPVVVFANKAGLDPETCYRVDEIAEILGCEEWDHQASPNGDGALLTPATATRPWCVKSTRSDGAGEGLRESVEWLKSRMGEVWKTAS